MYGHPCFLIKINQICFILMYEHKKLKCINISYLAHLFYGLKNLIKLINLKQKYLINKTKIIF